MNGKVIGRQPRMEITFALPNQPRLAIEFVIDTGFDGFLILPVAAVTALGLPFLHDVDANLADARRRSAPVHTVTIVWDGQERDVEVLAMGKRAVG